MSTATATFSDNTKTIGDKIAGLTLKEAKELSDYLKDVYGIEPAAGGAVMMAAAPTEAAGKPVVQTEFDVILKGFDPARKVNVIKLVREITAMSLMDGKKAVEAAPTKLKEGISKEEAEQLKKKVEEAGGQVEIK
jgi:large subunit ribosomal protein L7/L12